MSKLTLTDIACCVSALTEHRMLHSLQAQEAKEKTRGFFNSESDEAERQTDRAEDKARGFFGRASDDGRRTADRAQDEARGCA